MIRLTLDLSAVTPLNRMQIEHLTEVASRFSCRVLFEHNSRVINGKSMLGLLSLGRTGHEAVYLICDGEEEETAARTLQDQLLRGETAPKSAADGEALMHRIKDRYASILGDKLVGIYLHGSLAAGCFCWDRSDVDFLTVVNEPPRPHQKIALIQTIRDMEGEGPAGGFEMSVVEARFCRQAPYPIPFELHYSLAHRAEFDADPAAYCQRMRGEDPDLTAHILCLRAFGKTVLGPDIPRVFDQVNRGDALAAIRYDVKDAETSLHDNPVYYILNLCRALAYVRKNLVLSKKDGGQWALRHVSTDYQPVIQAALNAYATGIDITYDEEQAEDFAADALREIMTNHEGEKA